MEKSETHLTAVGRLLLIARTVMKPAFADAKPRCYVASGRHPASAAAISTADPHIALLR
jgi:hypothetical protein